MFLFCYKNANLNAFYIQGSKIGVRSVCTHAYFIGVWMILDVRLLPGTQIFSIGFFKVFKMFLVLIILHCSKTYSYIFDLYLFGT